MPTPSVSLRTTCPSGVAICPSRTDAASVVSSSDGADCDADDVLDMWA